MTALEAFELACGFAVLLLIAWALLGSAGGEP